MVRQFALLFALLFAFPAFGQVAVGVPSGPVGGLGPVVPQSNFFVLDHLASYPAEALSVRQLTAGQYLPAYDMTVRRSSDNATSNIGFVNGLLNTTALTSFCAVTNCYVVTWKNQGSFGSSGDATQSTAANQPQIVASGVVETQNGVPAVLFSASTLLATSTFSGSANFTSTVVLSVSVFGSTSTNFFNSVSPNLVFPFINPSLSNYFGTYDGANFTSNITPTLNSNYIFTNIRPTSGTFTSYINGASKITGSAGAVNLSNLKLGPSGTGGAFFAYEALGYQVLQSANDRAIYDPNAAKFYGISGVTQ